MTPSFMGLMATMLPGVRPSISFASLPTASTSPVFLLIATMEGSLTTMPLPLANTSVFAVPRSMARSDEKRLNRERRFIERGSLQEGPVQSQSIGNVSMIWEKRTAFLECALIVQIMQIFSGNLARRALPDHSNFTES